jgi:hypothetical protein
VHHDEDNATVPRIAEVNLLVGSISAPVSGSRTYSVGAGGLLLIVADRQVGQLFASAEERTVIGLIQRETNIPGTKSI